MRIFKRDGFTLIELMVVLVILAAIAIIGFNLTGLQAQSKAESQAKMIYSDLMRARETAVSQKRWVFVVFGTNSYSMYVDTYPAPDGNGIYDAGKDNPLLPPAAKVYQQVSMFYNGPSQLNISPDGLLSQSCYIYISSPTAPQLNCLSLSPTNIALGSWSGPWKPVGGNCAAK